MYIVLCTPLTAVAQDTNYIETLYPNGTVVNNLLAKQEMRVQSLGQEDPLEKGMAIHSSIHAWRIHGQRSLAEEPGRPQTIIWKIVGQD